jgi:CMP-N-acetylneuraminic acid synthetase
MGSAGSECRLIVAIIPARGGSTRIPRKNIVNFCDKPLIAWTIEAARECGLFKRIIVSTDDAEIASIAVDRGAEVPFHRDRYADDQTPVSVVTVHALEQLRGVLGEEYESVVQLMPNCPLRRASDIGDAYRHFVTSGSRFQISCFKFGWMNPWWAVTVDDRGRPAPLFPEMLKKRSQDLPDLYCPSGAIWIANARALMESKTFYGESHIFYPIDWKAAVDIDTSEDLEFARAVYEAHFASRSSSSAR